MVVVIIISMMQANGYYDKDPKDLNLYEASMLAGVPNAPSVYAPTNNLKLAEERQSQVLRAMAEFNVISEDEKDQIEAMQTTK